MHAAYQLNDGGITMNEVAQCSGDSGTGCSPLHMAVGLGPTSLLSQYMPRGTRACVTTIT